MGGNAVTRGPQKGFTPHMGGQSFFEEPKEQSLVKATIVQKYFWAWAKVIAPTAKKKGGKLAYIDLFAGPGRYVDGAKSTPLIILEHAIRDPDMQQMLVSIFNDRDAHNSRSLGKAIEQLPGIERLRHKPQVLNQTVGSDVVQVFESIKLIPTLFFVDPWGYKGLSLRLINSVLRNWGCDCIIFFNYNRINMGVGNEAVDDHMRALFDEERIQVLRHQLQGRSSHERELIIVEAMCQALKDMGGTYRLPFRFRHPTNRRTSHHLIFVSKHRLGYQIMKDIMAAESSSCDQGVPSFEYSRASKEQPLLFSLAQPLDRLEEALLREFAGRELTRDQLFNEHHIDTPYIKQNYDCVLRRLEDHGQIRIRYKGKGARRKHTYGPNTILVFPMGSP